ncbi:MAG: hypothetical protein ACRCS8_03435 [Brevinema sp.]
MKNVVLIMLILSHTAVFAQFSVNNPNITSYIEGNKLGLQINPNLTGTRTPKQNQEFDLNIALFYQDKHLLKDDTVLGVLNGRLISEEPLSSYDILEEIRSNDQISLSNFAQELPEFQNMIEQYQILLGHSNSAIYIEGGYEIQEEPVDDDYYGDYDYTSLDRSSQKMVAQAIPALSNEISMYDITEFLEKHYNSNLLEKQDLEFLIHYEKLKDSYRKILKEYNSYLSNEAASFKSSFDPADPNETFTLLLIGDQTKHKFSRQFGLDGKKNYQSHNNIVWYLGYSLPLTKKDVVALYNLFEKNESITYFINGSKGQIEFALTERVIVVMKQLLELYARGALIQNDDSDFPILKKNQK